MSFKIWITVICMHLNRKLNEFQYCEYTHMCVEWIPIYIGDVNIHSTLNFNWKFHDLHLHEYIDYTHFASECFYAIVLDCALTCPHISLSTRSLDCPPYVRFWDMRDITLTHRHSHSLTHTHTQNELLSLAWLRPNMNVRSEYICTRTCVYLCIFACVNMWMCECVSLCECESFVAAAIQDFWSI